jgi:photosystem II stability/assembly factor-like uncharacterized protein
MIKTRLPLILTLLLSLASVLAVSANDDPHDSLVINEKGEVRRWEITGPWGGDVRVLVVSPTNPDMFYLGTSDGQIFLSKDGARTWQRIKPGLDKRGISVDQIVIDPRDPRIMYVGVWAVAQGTEDEGVYKSEDGGLNWKLLKDTKGLTILALAMSPSDSNFLIAGAKSGVFRSTDGGKDWERISPEGHPEIHGINSVAIDPRNNDVIYAGTHHLAYKSTDGGKNWKLTSHKATGVIDDSDIMGLCVMPNDPNTVFINACSGIYRSTSAGEKWSKLPGIPFSARRTYALLPHPTDPNIIFAGTSEGLWRTKDGGKRWMLLTSKSVVIRSVVVDPDKPSRVLIATDDFGVRTSDNLGDDFTDANAGFIHRHILSIMPDVTERGRLLASVYHDGTAGSVFSSIDAGESWQSSSRGLGARDVFAFYQMPDNASVIYAGTNSGVFKSVDRGISWSFIGKPVEQKPEKKPAVRRGRRASAPEPALLSAPNLLGRYATQVAERKGQKSAAQSKKKATPQKKKPAPKPLEPEGPMLIELTKQVDDITSFVDSTGRRGLMAATLDGLYRTTDEARGWEKVFISGYEAGGRVFSVATHKDVPNRVFVGTRQGLFISNDGGSTWSHVDRGPSDMSVKAIAIDPRDPELVLVGTNQFVFRSTNGGRTWVRRGGGLPAGDFTSIVINPTNPEEVMVAEYSRGGIYRSTDRGYYWDRIDTELPSNRVWTLTFDPFDRDRIYAGSFSSGVYVLTIQRGAMNSSQ